MSSPENTKTTKNKSLAYNKLTEKQKQEIYQSTNLQDSLWKDLNEDAQRQVEQMYYFKNPNSKIKPEQRSDRTYDTQKQVLSQRYIIEQICQYRLTNFLHPEDENFCKIQLLIKWEGYKRRQWQPMGILYSDCYLEVYQFFAQKNLKIETKSDDKDNEFFCLSEHIFDQEKLKQQKKDSDEMWKNRLNKTENLGDFTQILHETTKGLGKNKHSSVKRINNEIEKQNVKSQTKLIDKKPQKEKNQQQQINHLNFDMSKPSAKDANLLKGKKEIKQPEVDHLSTNEAKNYSQDKESKDEYVEPTTPVQYQAPMSPQYNPIQTGNTFKENMRENRLDKAQITASLKKDDYMAEIRNACESNTFDQYNECDELEVGTVERSQSSRTSTQGTLSKSQKRRQRQKQNDSKLSEEEIVSKMNKISSQSNLSKTQKVYKQKLSQMLLQKRENKRKRKIEI